MFGRSYAAEPDVLVEQLKKDEAIAEADTLLLTVPNQLGVDYNAHVIEAILKHVAARDGLAVSAALYACPAACRIKFAMVSGCEISDTWLAFTSMVLALMRLAMKRSRSGLMVRSSVDTA